MFYKKGVLKNFTTFTGRHLRRSVFFKKVAKKETPAQVFSCFTEHLRAAAFAVTLMKLSLDKVMIVIVMFIILSWSVVVSFFRFNSPTAFKILIS